MASFSDQLRTLPPELRHCIYTYLLYDDEDNTVGIRQKYDTGEEEGYELDPLAILALPEDPVYLAHSKKKRDNHQWRDEIDEAFFQGEWHCPFNAFRLIL